MIKKSFLGFAYILCILLANNVSAETKQLQDSVVLSVSSSRGLPSSSGNSCTINLDNSMGVAGSQYNLMFDTTLLSLDSVHSSSRSAHMDFGHNKIIGGVRVLMFSLSGDSVLPDSGAITEVFFSVSDSAALNDSTPLQLQDCIVSDPGASYIPCFSVNNWFRFSIQGVEDNHVRTPDKVGVLSLTPSLSMGKFAIKYSVLQKSPVSLSIYALSGKLIKSLYSGIQEKGDYDIDVQGEKLTGIYFIRLEAGNYKETKKLLLMK
jgi:hypothetical protein